MEIDLRRRPMRGFLSARALVFVYVKNDMNWNDTHLVFASRLALVQPFMPSSYTGV